MINHKTSKSWEEGVRKYKIQDFKSSTWTISFFLWTSPLGSGTYSSASRSNSVAKASLRPTLFTAPLFASMYITSPTATCTLCHKSQINTSKFWLLYTTSTETDNKRNSMEIKNSPFFLIKASYMVGSNFSYLVPFTVFNPIITWLILLPWPLVTLLVLQGRARLPCTNNTSQLDINDNDIGREKSTTTPS